MDPMDTVFNNNDAGMANLRECLQYVLSPDQNLRHMAEKQLKILENNEEFGLYLTQMAIDANAPFVIRHLACVLLKQYVHNHWSTASEKFTPPQPSDEIKARVRELLPMSLQESLSRIRSGGAYAIGAIAHYDWPDQWPNLFDIITAGITSNKPDYVQGTMRVLAEFVSVVNEQQIEHIAPILLPELLKIFTETETFSVQTRARAVSIFTSIANLIYNLGQRDKTAPKRLLFLSLVRYGDAFVQALERPDLKASEICIKVEIIKAVSALIEKFPKQMNRFLPGILPPATGLLSRCSDMYVQTVVNGENDEDSIADSEGEALGFEQLVFALIELIQVLLDRPLSAQPIIESLRAFLYILLIYMEIPDEKVTEWLKTTDRYLEDEDEEMAISTVRAASVDLLIKLADLYPTETVNALCSAVKRHVDETENRMAAGDKNWWKARESCYLAMGSVASTLKYTIEKSGCSSDFDLLDFLKTAWTSDLTYQDSVFLQGQALWFSCRMAGILAPAVVEKLISIFSKTLTITTKPMVQVFACRAFYHFCVFLKESELGATITSCPEWKQILGNLVSLGVRGGETILNLVLTTLSLAIEANPVVASSGELKIVSLATAAMLKHNGDPSIPTQVAEIVQQLMAIPQSRPEVERIMLTPIVSVLSCDDKTKLPLRLPAVCLEVLESMVRGSEQPISEALLKKGFPAAVKCLLNSDDANTLQAGRECIRAFISKAADQVINWRDDTMNVDGVSLIMRIIQHLLSPAAPEISASFVGRLIYVLLRRANNAVLPHLEQILQAILLKMEHSELNVVHQSLLMVFAHLIHFHLDAVVQFLSSVKTPDGSDALQCVLLMWCEKQKMFFGSYDQKVSILALCKIFFYAVSSPDNLRLRQIMVRNAVMKSPSDSSQPSTIPLLVKIFKLVIYELNGLMYMRSAHYVASDNAEDGSNDDGVSGDQMVRAVEPFVTAITTDMGDDVLEENDDPDVADDTLSQMDLTQELKNFITVLSQQPYYAEFCTYLSDEERGVLRKADLRC